MNNIVKYILFVMITTVVAVVLLVPVVTHQNEYKVVIVNASERPINHVVISGAGVNSDKLGPVQPGNIQDFIFMPEQNGILKYQLVQNSQTLEGVINKDLKKGDVGDVFVVVGELQKVRIYDEYDGAY